MDRAALAHLRHEVRTPLNHIIGYSEMLLEDMAAADSAVFEPGLRRVQEEARKLMLLVNDFFGKVPADGGEVDLAGLTSQLTSPLQSIINAVEALSGQAAQADAQGMHEDLGRIALAVSNLQALLSSGVSSPSTQSGATQRPALDAPAVERHVETGLILVVDDNQSNREILERRLTRDGHRVIVASGGAQALELVRQQHVDLVLLDVMMPDMNGYEVLHHLKADSELRNIPVLMISALDEIESVVHCIELGAEDYLPKPFNAVLLRARIGACLEKKRLRDREAQHLHELAEWNRTLEQRVAEQVALLERLGRLKRFFSPQLAELIVAGGAEDPLKTHRRDVTVVFVDLRGFTAFAETAEPEEVMGVLREYHAEVGKLILEHEGTLERFAGDGMMIFFNDPVPVPNPGERAVRMALAVRQCAAQLIEKWRKLGYDLDLSIGIAQGYATIGAIGFEGRWDYGAIGSVTNLAARLCAEAKPGQILISKRVLATTEALLRVESAGELSLKGFHRPIPAYSILGLEA